MTEKTTQKTTKKANPANTWGMLCHLTSLSMYIGIPLGNIVGPLIIWLLKKEEFPFVDEQGKESLNFQISLMIYGIISGILCFIVIGFLLLGALVIFDIVMVILASIKTSEGKSFQYPLTIRMIK